jgi:hypothetical protein
MADQPKKDEAAAASAVAGTGGSGPDRAVPENERLNAILLGIIEREVGRGEPRRAEDWNTLREMAVAHAAGIELVATFEGVIDRCNREMIGRFGAHGVDLTRLRESVVMLIRVSLAKKLGLDNAPVRES